MLKICNVHSDDDNGFCPTCKKAIDEVLPVFPSTSDLEVEMSKKKCDELRNVAKQLEERLKQTRIALKKAKIALKKSKIALKKKGIAFKKIAGDLKKRKCADLMVSKMMRSMKFKNYKLYKIMF